MLERKHSSDLSGGPTSGSEAAAASRSILELATLSRKNSAKSVASSPGSECLGRALMSDLPDSELTILYSDTGQSHSFGTLEEVVTSLHFVLKNLFVNR